VTRAPPNAIRLALLFVAAAAAASLAPRVCAAATVTVTVTGVAGRSVFLDQGRRAGIATGMTVRLSPAGAARIDAVVRDVSATSCRAEIVQGLSLPPVGTTGQVEVPDGASADESPTSQPTTVPAHPPWTRQEEPRSPDMPLLAPAFATPPNKRPPTFHGRVFQDFNATLDKGGDRDNKYFLSRTGTTFTVTNPFGQGGELNFDGEYDYRNADVNSARGNTSDTDLIINRLSYAIGTEQYAPYRLELGRFTSFYLPEIGLVDGVEAAVRMRNGLNLGGGFGLYPWPFPERHEGQDYGFHVFADYASPDQKVAGTIGYQKTWHDGDPDRDLLVGRGSLCLTPHLWLYGSARVDLFTSRDTLATSDIGLTDAWVQARYTPDNTRGLAFSYSHYDWPDTIRREFPPQIPPQTIKNGRVDRIELSGWHDIAKDLRPTARVWYFMDDRTDGFGGELDLDWTGVGRRPFDLHGAVFYADGEYTDDYGFRLQGDWRKGDLDVFLGYELMAFKSNDAFSGGDTNIQHTIRGGVGWSFDPWYLNVTVDKTFGDGEDGYTFGTYLSYRF
jgi:hypothetical protein